MKKIVTSTDSNELIPDFSLPSTEGGRMLGTADFRQLSNLLIFFFHDWSCGHCRELLRSLKAKKELFDWLDTRVLAIARSPLSDLAQAAIELEPEIVLLSDADGRVTARFASEGQADLPFLVIADRYEALFARLELDAGDEIDFHEVESTLLFIATQCPECGRPKGDSVAM